MQDNNDVSNWVTILATIPIGVSTALIFYLINKSVIKDRQQNAATDILSVLLPWAIILAGVKTEHHELKLKFLKENKSEDSLLSIYIKRIMDIENGNSDVLSDLSPYINKLWADWTISIRIVEQPEREKDTVLLLDKLSETTEKIAKVILLIIGEKKYEEYYERVVKTMNMQMEGYSLEDVLNENKRKE